MDPASPPRVGWTRLEAKLRSVWVPGEHFSVIATTGGGKSYLATRGLLPIRKNVVILDAKGGDKTLTSTGYKRRKGWPTRLEIVLDEERRYRINPPYGRSATIAFDQVFREAWKGFSKIDRAAREAFGLPPTDDDDGWTIFFDEARVLSDKLKLRSHIEQVMVAGRSKKVTVVAAFQAARYVPSEMYDQPTYLALGNVRDRKTLSRLAEIGGDTDLLKQILPTLKKTSNGPSEFLFLGPDWAAISTYRRGRSPRRD